MINSHKWKSQRISEQAQYERLALLKSIGFREDELKKPIIAVIHGWNEMGPGDYHLKGVAQAVKASIRSNGGTPVEIIIPGLCAGMNSGTLEARYSFPYRDFAAGMVEIMLHAYQCDAAVVIPTCDYTVPAFLIGIARVNIPSIVLTGGYMQVGDYHGKPIIVTDTAVAYVAKKTGKITDSEFQDIVDNACPGAGACPLMATASTMAVVTEALGMALPHNSTTPSNSGKILRMAKQIGFQIMKILEMDLRPSKIMTLKSFNNAIKVVLAVGGSMNSVIHLSAIASELDINLNLDLWDKLSRITPFICSLMPNHPYNTIRELENAGGTPALMKELQSLLNLEVMTVTCKKLKENLEKVIIKDRNVIRSLDNPFRNEGGIAILSGNLAPGGAVVKASAVPVSMLKHSGPAKVFNSEEEAIQGLMTGKIAKGDVLVIKFEGPKGGPGAREPQLVMHTIFGLGLGETVALISDSRFSGTNKGCVIGHVCPEAAEGGPIAIVKKGDIINIDIPNRKLELCISQSELNKRLKEWKSPPPKATKGVLGIYSRIAKPLNIGGGF
jgi:dihydroxy-acid dehydratase